MKKPGSYNPSTNARPSAPRVPQGVNAFQPPDHAATPPAPLAHTNRPAVPNVPRARPPVHAHVNPIQQKPAGRPTGQVAPGTPAAPTFGVLRVTPVQPKWPSTPTRRVAVQRAVPSPRFGRSPRVVQRMQTSSTQFQRAHIEDLAAIRYSESAEIFEDNLGAYLARHPAAIAAAEEMSNGLWKMFLGKKREESEYTKFGRADKASAGSVGMDPKAIALVPSTGNLRERLTFVLAAIRSGIAGELFGKSIPKFDDPKKERTADQRQEFEEGPSRLTLQHPDQVKSPPLSGAERAYTVESGKLNWEPGSRVIGYKMNTPYQRKAEQELRLVAAGPSGTAFAMLYVADFFKIDLQHARLALLTWMLTVGDHSFDEIMEGCHLWAQKEGRPGLDYNRGAMDRYRRIPPLSETELRQHVCLYGQFPDECLTSEYKKQLHQELWQS